MVEVCRCLFGLHPRRFGCGALPGVEGAVTRWGTVIFLVEAGRPNKGVSGLFPSLFVSLGSKGELTRQRRFDTGSQTKGLGISRNGNVGIGARKFSSQALGSTRKRGDPSRHNRRAGGGR